MKTALKQIILVILILTLGFVTGRAFQHTRTGYYFEVREKEEYAFPLGEIRWSYVTESVGIPFLDPGTTIIEYEGRTLYKAKRGFQESFPFAQNIQTSGNSIDWSDGEYSFHLTIAKEEKKTEPNQAMQRTSAAVTDRAPSSTLRASHDRGSL